MNIPNKFTSVVYQIYVKSFNDTNGDGLGDLRGVIEKLDYLKELGVDYVWLTPFFISPQKDNGYDVANYKAVDPRYGTMNDVEELIEEAKKRDIKIMLDMVLNHTSTDHEWFQKAMSGDQKHKEFYIFKDEPTNWLSKFGGPAWKYVEKFDQYYLCLFDVTQADLNWENPEVREELYNVVNFWLDKGVKGLRFDVVNLVSKPDVYEDDYMGDGRRFYTDGPRIHEYMRLLNQNTFGKYEDILTVGEMSSTNIENGVKYAKPDRSELDMIFNFHHLKVDYDGGRKWHNKPFDFLEYKKIISDWQLAMQEHEAYNSSFLNCHDQPRSVSRFGDDVNYHYESATMLATTMHLVRGMPYIYQGEEYGLPNAYFKSMDDFRDVESHNNYEIEIKERDEKEVFEAILAKSRDNGRTPMVWDDSEKHGFTTGIPWINFSQHPDLKSAEKDMNSEQSIFKYYQRLIQLRKQEPVVSIGSIKFLALEHPQLFIFEREFENKVWTVIANFYGQEVEYPLEGEIVLSNIKRNELASKIKPYEALVLERKK